MEATNIVTGEIVMAVADEINYEHRLFMDSMRTGLAHAIRCGELLIDQKFKLGHGEWLKWVEENCKFGERTARAYMQVASNRQSSADLPDSATSICGALRLLAEPKEVREKKIEQAPEVKELVFSWVNQGAILAMWEGSRAIKAAVAELESTSRDVDTADYELIMITKDMLQIVKGIAFHQGYTFAEEVKNILKEML